MVPLPLARLFCGIDLRLSIIRQVKLVEASSVDRISPDEMFTQVRVLLKHRDDSTGSTKTTAAAGALALTDMVPRIEDYFSTLVRRPQTAAERTGSNTTV